jgi:hypothetical protein
MAPTSRTMAASLGKDADDLGTALDLAVQPFERIGGMELGAMLSGEVHVGEHVGRGFVHQRRELWDLGPELIGDAAPLLLGRLGVVLGEGGGDEGRDDTPAAPAGMGQNVAHEVDASALPSGGEDLRHRRLDALMSIGDDQLDATQAAARPLRAASRRRELGIQSEQPSVERRFRMDDGVELVALAVTALGSAPTWNAIISENYSGILKII